MQSTSIALTLLAHGSGLVSAVLQRVQINSGDLNYGHHAFDLHEVTMDDSSHSVYQAGTGWYLFNGKTSNDGPCEGKILGTVTGGMSPCLDLDNTFTGERIRYLCNPLIGANTNGINSCEFLTKVKGALETRGRCE